jgi:hypothetical protein
MWPFKSKPINPVDNPRKWIEKRYRSWQNMRTVVYANIVYKDDNDRNLDMSKYFPLMIKGDKLKCCNIFDGNIALCTTPEYLESIHRIKNKEFGIFSSGDICQIAFQGLYNTPFDEVWEKCLDCKSDFLINKDKENLKEEIGLLQYDKDFEEEYIIAFKYVWSENLKNYKKEWHIYFKSELIAICKYVYSLKR